MSHSHLYDFLVTKSPSDITVTFKYIYHHDHCKYTNIPVHVYPRIPFNTYRISKNFTNYSLYPWK